MVKRVKDGTSMWNRQYVYRNGDFLTPALAALLMRQGIQRFFISTHGRDPVELRRHFESFIPKDSLRIVVMHDEEPFVCNRGGAVAVFNKTEGMTVCNRGAYKICPIIAWNGDLMLCHNDYHRVHPVGNIADKSLRWKAATSACRSAICECYVPKMGLTIQ